MRQELVEKLYDNLFKWEKGKNRKSYPIHKKLDDKKFEHEDIYHWLAINYPEIENKHVLDAGCGVGYGTLYLANNFNCFIKGISLSQNEVDKANQHKINMGLEKRAMFKKQSYDNLESDNYDFIIAIESVKHTLHLETTLNAFKKALKINGKLIIIDDFLISHKSCKIIKSYANDWELVYVFSLKDFIRVLPAIELRKDLTDYVKPKSTVLLRIGIFITNLLAYFNPAYRIIRGGFYLEQLFRKKKMKYYVVEYTK